MKLFNKKTVRDIMNFTDDDMEKELKAGNWNIGDEWKLWETNKDNDMWIARDIMPRAITYAHRKYPADTIRETGIFAVLVEGFTTGIFGGFGQDQDPLYGKAEEAVLALAGGVPANINDPENKMFGLTPPLDEKGETKTLLSKEEFTRAGIQLLENICFNSQETALEEALKYLTGSIKLQEKSRQAFKSKTIEESTVLAERAKQILEKLLK